MGKQDLWGYRGKILRVNLSNGSIEEEKLPAEMIEMYVGGTGFGAEYLYREVPPGVSWDSPENRIIMAAGPLAGTTLSGTGTFSLVTKSSMTNLAISTQANGFWGAYLKFAGYDAIIIQGKSPKWVYLYLDEGKPQLRDASAILGKDTWDIEKEILRETGSPRKISVYGIGPAGENLVRYAIVAGDNGHILSKGGCGCVLGSKRLKAVAIVRLHNPVPVYDKKLFNQKAKALSKFAIEERGGLLYKYGTTGIVNPHYKRGSFPVRNYTSNIFPEYEKMNGPYFRERFEHRKKACWVCQLAHNRYTKVTEGPYKGFEGEEPEYEAIAGWGPLVGNTDAGAVVMLSNLTDRLGLDANEASFTVAWVIECFEKGLLKKKDLDGLEMRWGDVEAIKTLLLKICRREGIGDLLAEGVMRASAKIGGEAADMGIYVKKGVTPRGHDHRAVWTEMLETCVSATGTLQSGSRLLVLKRLGLPPQENSFSPWEVAAVNAKTDGWYVFIDCLGVCRFITIDPTLTFECLHAATGRDFTLPDAMKIGRRIINQLRVFNFRHGLDPDLEVPSTRYGSTPVDGPAEGQSVMTYFKWMKSFYFELSGWDPATGKPLPHTLELLGLEKLIPDLDF